MQKLLLDFEVAFNTPDEFGTHVDRLLSVGKYRRAAVNGIIFGQTLHQQETQLLEKLVSYQTHQFKFVKL